MQVNNITVACHLSMKLSDVFDQNTHHTFEKIVGKTMQMKNVPQLDFKPKGQGHNKCQKQIPQEAIN